MTRRARRAAGTATILSATLATVLGSGGSALAQTVRVASDTRVVGRDVVREIHRAVDVPLVRDLGREIALAVRGAIADIPWRDMGWDKLPWSDLPWRDIAAAAGAQQDRDFPAVQTEKETRTI